MKKKLPSPSLLDRAITAISPQWGLERHKSRVAMAITGGYSGARYNEALYNFQPGIGDADADSLRDLRELRARSRDLVRNSAIAGGAIETQVTHVIGAGLRFQSRIDHESLGMDEETAEQWQCNTEKLFRLWAESDNADAFGNQTFYELQDLAFRSNLESGDSFTVLTKVNRGDFWPFGLALQVIEADRVCNENFRADDDQFTGGIERDKDHFPVAAWICNRHPGRYLSPTDFKWTRVEFRGKSGRRNVIQLMRKLRPGQTRGVPCLAPIIEPLKQLTRYSQAEVDAAVNSAMFALFVRMDADVFQDVFDDTAQEAIIDNAKRWDGSLRSGAAVNLMPGESIESAGMNRPNPNFDPFVSAFMGQIGMGLNIPKEVLTKHFQSSYSAARAALLDAWRTFKIRRQWMAQKWCQPIYEEWLADAVASGLVVAPGFFADPLTRAAWVGASWCGDGPGAIDPLKEVQAASERVNMGLTTLPEEILAYDGGDWESKHREQANVQAEREEAGLAAPVTQPLPGAAAPVQSGAKKENDDSGDAAIRGLKRARAIRASLEG